MGFEIPRGIDPDAYWRSMPFAFLDTETTGVIDGSRVVEIAVVRFEPDGTFKDEFGTLVDPQMLIPRAAQKVHHITDKMVKGQPTFEDVYPRLIELLRGHVPGAYNLAFDYRILRDQAQGHGRKWFGFFGIDPMVLARKFVKSIPGGMSQANLLQHLGMHEGTKDHRALGDTRHTGKLFFEYFIPHHLSDNWTFQQFWDIQVHAARQHEQKMKIQYQGKKISSPWHDYTKEQ
jgi:DNA polymerase III epsilon subunit-like protein